MTERVEDVTGTSPQSPAFPLIVPGCFHFSFLQPAERPPVLPSSEDANIAGGVWGAGTASTSLYSEQKTGRNRGPGNVCLKLQAGHTWDSGLVGLQVCHMFGR